MSLENHTTKRALHKCSKALLSGLARPGYSQTLTFPPAPTTEEEPIVPAPSLFNFDDASLTEEAFDVRRLPHPAQCATHLQLLEVFFVLRQRILISEEIDAGFGIEPQRETKTGRQGDEKTFKDATLWDRRQIKWTRFIEFAVVRFLVWRKCISQSPNTMLKKTEGGHLLLQNLPPLDVLMVWHSFMLNPRLLSKYCSDESLYRVGMPWKTVHGAISNRDWAFSHEKTDSDHFERQTNLSADLFEMFSQWSILSPSTPNLATFELPASRLQTEGTTGPDELDIKSDDSLYQKYSKAFTSVDSELAVKLRDAVVRQTSFVDKMNDRLWIRSPEVKGTIRRAIGRYKNFLTLLKLYPGHTIVPTLDIDLVWHTHQCTSIVYAEATKAIVGRFINHDDTIAKDSLATSYDASKIYYRVHFGTEYRICGCWDCEALLSAVEDATQAGEEPDMTALAKKTQDRVTYYRAVEIAIRSKKPLPLYI